MSTKSLVNARIDALKQLIMAFEALYPDALDKFAHISIGELNLNQDDLQDDIEHIDSVVRSYVYAYGTIDGAMFTTLMQERQAVLGLLHILITVSDSELELLADELENA